nr:hypothetical protein [uncultured Noviherbaspirillum sp.]
MKATSAFNSQFRNATPVIIKGTAIGRSKSGKGPTPRTGLRHFFASIKDFFSRSILSLTIRSGFRSENRASKPNPSVADAQSVKFSSRLSNAKDKKSLVKLRNDIEKSAKEHPADCDKLEVLLRQIGLKLNSPGADNYIPAAHGPAYMGF